MAKGCKRLNVVMHPGEDPGGAQFKKNSNEKKNQRSVLVLKYLGHLNGKHVPETKIQALNFPHFPIMSYRSHHSNYLVFIFLNTSLGVQLFYFNLWDYFFPCCFCLKASINEELSS